MLYYMHEQHTFMCTLQLKGSLTVDGTCICSVHSLLLQYKFICCNGPARRAGTNASTTINRLWFLTVAYLVTRTINLNIWCGGLNGYTMV